MMTETDDESVRRAVQDLPFPAERRDIVDHAVRQAVDPTVIEALAALPDRIFSTVDDVVISVPQHADRS